MFLSHTHLDHIMGFPFFGPFWHKDHTVNIYAGHLAPTGGVHAFFTNTFKDPLFPVPFAAMPATKNCIDFIAGASFQFGDVTVETHELNHPNGAIGYRLTYKGKSVCYVTDHEHDAKANRQGLVDFINGTDLFIYDSTYSDQNYESFKGWGHSTWQEALRLGQDANVRRTGIFHHDPQNTDAKMRAIEEQVQNTCPKGLVTRQGMIVDLT
jgi:phosphoribosyl 1,2-cyclic phosphodiesterase